MFLLLIATFLGDWRYEGFASDPAPPDRVVAPAARPSPIEPAPLASRVQAQAETPQQPPSSPPLPPPPPISPAEGGKPPAAPPRSPTAPKLAPRRPRTIRVDFAQRPLIRTLSLSPRESVAEGRVRASAPPPPFLSPPHGSPAMLCISLFLEPH
jgi:hypothetical protein